jgi:uncharacterized protein involved in response to NO
MAMTAALKARRDPARARLPIWATLLVAAATVARALAGVEGPHAQGLLPLAALCWSGAFALLLIHFARPRRLDPG